MAGKKRTRKPRTRVTEQKVQAVARQVIEAYKDTIENDRELAKSRLFTSTNGKVYQGRADDGQTVNLALVRAIVKVLLIQLDERGLL